MKPKVLYIADCNPEVKSGHGNMIKMHHKIICEIFSSEVYTFFCNGDLKSYDGEKTWVIPNNGTIGKFFSVMSGLPAYLSLSAERLIFKTLREYEFSYVYIDNSISGKIIKKIKKKYKNIKVVVYFPDIEQDLMKKQIEYARLYRKISLKQMINNEKLTAKYSDYNIVLNERDKNLFNKYYKTKPNAVIPIVVPYYEKIQSSKRHLPKQKLEILFLGVDYKPNVDGINWLIKNVLPLVSVDYHVSIVGYNMERYRSNWECNGNVSVIGTVDSVMQYYLNSDAVIAPISDGGGMKVKTAEAFEFGKIFIGLPESLEGYWEEIPENLKNKYIFRVDNAIDFAEIINCLSNITFFKVNDAIRQWMKQKYSYEAVLRQYKRIFITDKNSLEENNA